MSQVEFEPEEVEGMPLHVAVFGPFGITEEDTRKHRELVGGILVRRMEELTALWDERENKQTDPGSVDNVARVCKDFIETEIEYISFREPEAEILDYIKLRYMMARQLFRAGASFNQVRDEIMEKSPDIGKYLHFLNDGPWWAYQLSQAITNEISRQNFRIWKAQRSPSAEA